METTANMAQVFMNMIYEYGFVIIFSAIMLFIIYRIINSALAVYNKRQDAKLEMEQKNHESRLADENEKRKLLMSVQDKQTETLNAILKAQELLCKEFAINESILRAVVGDIGSQGLNMDNVMKRYETLKYDLLAIKTFISAVDSKVDIILELLKTNEARTR